MIGNSNNIFQIIFSSVAGLLGAVDFAGLFGGLTEGLGGFFQALVAPWLGS